jgi:outer membrane biogenesis lipoprotein LolB
MLAISCIYSCANHKDITNNNLTPLYPINKQQFTSNHNKIINWHAKGKISYHDHSCYPYTTCYIDWLKTPDKSTVSLHSALNLQNVVLEYQNNNLRLLSKNGKAYNNPNKNPELADIKYTIQELSLNLNNLTNWIIGIPNLDKPYSLTQHGFNQDNWQIHYDKFKFLPYDNLCVPKKIIMKNYADSPSDKPIVIKIIITNFELK